MPRRRSWTTGWNRSDCLDEIASIMGSAHYLADYAHLIERRIVPWNLPKFYNLMLKFPTYSLMGILKEMGGDLCRNTQ